MPPSLICYPCFDDVIFCCDLLHSKPSCRVNFSLNLHLILADNIIGFFTSSNWSLLLTQHGYFLVFLCSRFLGEVSHSFSGSIHFSAHYAVLSGVHCFEYFHLDTHTCLVIVLCVSYTSVFSSAGT